MDMLGKPESRTLRQNGGAVLDELLVEFEGDLYLGQLWLGAGPKPSPCTPQYWQFANRGHVVAEFPATRLDTPANVREQFLTVWRGSRR
jgi:hypothetical protein